MRLVESRILAVARQRQALPEVHVRLRLILALAMMIGTAGWASDQAQAQQTGSKRTVHTARNVGSGTGAELATYVVEKGKPLITLVK